jgi:hypothetical protein
MVVTALARAAVHAAFTTTGVRAVEQVPPGHSVSIRALSSRTAVSLAVVRPVLIDLATNDR